MDQRPVRQDWGIARDIAPTERRTTPMTFLAGSLVLGLMVFGFLLWLSWCALPVLGAPAAPFGAFARFGTFWLAHFALPHTFTHEAAQFSTWLGQLTTQQTAGILVRVGFASVGAVLPAFFLARIHLKPRDGMMDIRGAKRFELESGKTELQRHLATIPNAIPDLPLAPEVVYPSQLWTQHVLLVGGVGAGKSTFLRPLLAAIVKSKEHLLCYDPKGEFTAAFGKTVILAPWDARSLGWDIARDLRNLGDMERFAGALIPGSTDPMWANSARGVLIGLLVYLQTARGQDWGWTDLADLISMPDDDLLKLMQRYYPEAARAVTGGNVTTKGILINLDAFSRPIFHLARAWGDLPPERRISFVQWTQGQSSQTMGAPDGAVANGANTNGPAGANAPSGATESSDNTRAAGTPPNGSPACPRQIILQGNGAYPELTRAYVHGIFAVIGGIVNSVEIADDPKRKLWIVADEFAQMGKIPIRPLFEVGRSRGVRCIVACQDFAQLEEVHGKEATRALISLCGTVMVGRVGPGETAEILSKALGHREVERSNISTSYDGKPGAGGPTTTLTYSRDSLALYVPAELAYRLGEKPALGGCVFAVAVQGRVYELLWPYVTLKKVRHQHVPAKWTLGVNIDAGLVNVGGAAYKADAMPPKAGAQKPADQVKAPSMSGPAFSSAIAATAMQSGSSTQYNRPAQAAQDSTDSDVSPTDASPSDPTLSRVSRGIPGEVPGKSTGISHQSVKPKDSKQPVTPMTPVTVMTVSGTTAPVDGQGEKGEAETEEFEGIEAAQEALVSHDPAEAAAKLALKALEMLRARPGPRQKVVPAVVQRSLRGLD